jgi:hypothetical protein
MSLRTWSLEPAAAPVLGAPMEPVEPVCELASGVAPVEGAVCEEELEPVCALELLSGVVLLWEDAVPGVVLVLEEDCEDCDPQLELDDASGEVLLEGADVALEELLLCGLLLDVELGEDVLCDELD